MSISAPGALAVDGELQGPGGLRTRPITQSEPMSRFQSTISCSAHSVRHFKACRVCRRHKLKCERSDDGTCRRCRDNGVQCVYDTIGSRKRDAATKRGDMRTRSRPRRTSPDPESPVDRARPSTTQTVTIDSNLVPSSSVGPSSPPPPPSHTVAAARGSDVKDSSASASASLPGHHPPPAQPSELTSEDLRAPVSAFNNMSRCQGSIQCQSKTPSSTGYGADQQSALRSGLLFGRDTDKGDMISKGIIHQRLARQLFNSFMSGASVFLPIFDPILDSFETLRLREPFCFAVILTLASCIDGLVHRKQCLSEVKELLARSLFHYPASLGNVQGMLLLVVYAESTWFAIGHALQMALDLGLDKVLSHEEMPDDEGSSGHTAGQRGAIRRARVWFALCFIEREVAIGTARSSRISKMSATHLAHFTCHSQAHPPNMRLAALVEAVQIRGLTFGLQSTQSLANQKVDEFFTEIATAEDLEENGLDRLISMQTRFEEWLQRWDVLHEDCGYDVSSFQRTGLHGQKHYAMIFLGCATIGRVSRNQQLSVAIKDTSGPLSDIIGFVMDIAMKQLHHVLRSESYKWHLRWANNYTMLSLAFTGIFALEISRHRDDRNTRQIFNTVSKISEILTDYHDPFFRQLVEVRLSRHPGAPQLEPRPANFGYHSPNSASAQQFPVNAAASGVQFQLPVEDVREPLAAGVGIEGLCIDTLNQFLETPDWMLNPSSMLFFDANSWQNNEAFPVGC